MNGNKLYGSIFIGILIIAAVISGIILMNTTDPDDIDEKSDFNIVGEGIIEVSQNRSLLTLRALLFAGEATIFAGEKTENTPNINLTNVWGNELEISFEPFEPEAEKVGTSWKYFEFSSEKIPEEGLTINFEANPPASTNNQFFAFGDSQGTTEILNQIVEIANEQKPAFVIGLGDLSSFGTQEQLQSFVEITNNLEVPLFLTPGNHDVKENGLEYYHSLWGSGNYSFSFGNYTFVSVDTSSIEVSNDQLDWLEGKLQGDSKKVVFTHVPIFDPREVDEPHALPDTLETSRFQEIIDAYEVDLFLSGHIHMFNQTRKENTTYVISGGGGASLYASLGSGGFYHYINITVGEEVSVTSNPLFGEQTIPELTIIKGDLEIVYSLAELIQLSHVNYTGQFQNRFDNWNGYGTYLVIPISILLGDFVLETSEKLIAEASDGFSNTFSYSNVYPNATMLAAQGIMGVAIALNNSYPPDWDDGFRIIFMTPDGNYSNEDCINTSEPGCGCQVYKSAGSVLVRNLVTIRIVAG
jgi:3',5'-cyclic AMP phosphodiesterase CpdA